MGKLFPPLWPDRLLWRIALFAGLSTAGLCILLSSSHAAPAAIETGLIALASSIAFFILLKRPLAQIHQAARFADELAALEGKQLPTPTAPVEIADLAAALNRTSRKLHAQDAALNHAMTELREQHYAFDQHAIVSIIDLHGDMQYANDCLCAFSGYARNDLIGRPFTLLSAEPDPAAHHRMLWDKLQRGEVWHGEMRVKTQAGAIGWVDASVVPIRDIAGQVRHYICIQTDVTERKRNAEALAANQKALEMLTANLEQLIKERTAELEKSNGELAQANQVKSDFISIVSHELRTPLTSIKSFAEILLDDTEDPDAKRCLRIINDEADRLNRLINDILDLQKIGAGRMVWRDEKVNLVDIARAAVESFSGAYSAKDIGLELQVADNALYAMTDSDKIRQVLANLLSNALKFTQTGKVTVGVNRIWDAQTKSAYIQLAIADTGPGLAASQLERVFEQFYQVENEHARKVQGTGLGLAICKEIIDHYRGRIWAESCAGQGTTMLFTLPDASGASKKLGEILVDLGYITDQEIEQALQHQRQIDAPQTPPIKRDTGDA